MIGDIEFIQGEIPENMLPCDGRELLISDYTDLYKAIQDLPMFKSIGTDRKKAIPADQFMSKTDDPNKRADVSKLPGTRYGGDGVGTFCLPNFDTGDDQARYCIVATVAAPPEDPQP